MKLLRNHASLALWVGGNEQVPADDINTALTSELALNQTYRTSSYTSCDELDVTLYLDGTRLYVQGSLWEGFADGEGGWSDGPYGIQNPEDFYDDDFYGFAFNPEIGSVAVPFAATIRATMPEEAWAFPQIVESQDGVEEVPNPHWDYHKYLPYSGWVLFSIPSSICPLASLFAMAVFEEGMTFFCWKGISERSPSLFTLPVQGEQCSSSDCGVRPAQGS